MSDRADDADSRVTVSDLEESFSRLTGESDEGPVPMQRPAIVVGAAVVSGLLVLAKRKWRLDGVSLGRYDDAGSALRKPEKTSHRT